MILPRTWPVSSSHDCGRVRTGNALKLPHSERRGIGAARMREHWSGPEAKFLSRTTDQATRPNRHERPFTLPIEPSRSSRNRTRANIVKWRSLQDAHYAPLWPRSARPQAPASARDSSRERHALGGEPPCCGDTRRTNPSGRTRSQAPLRPLPAATCRHRSETVDSSQMPVPAWTDVLVWRRRRATGCSFGFAALAHRGE